jgi:hypothetical protein
LLWYQTTVRRAEGGAGRNNDSCPVLNVVYEIVNQLKKEGEEFNEKTE